MGDLSLDPHLLTYSIIYLYQFRIMHIYFTLWIIQYYFIYFIAHTVPALATRSWVDSYAPLIYPHQIFYFAFLSLIISLIFGTIRCSRLIISGIFPILVLESDIYWRMVLKTKVWALGTVIATG